MTKQKNWFFSCYQAKNPHALLIVGTYKYFLNEEFVKGKKLIEEALACGNFIVTYTHGVMLLCESNPKGIIKLLEILNDEHGKHWLLKCQKILWLLAAGTVLCQIPNFQACQKTGMEHWNRDEPYPYGYEEFVDTCKRCLIDLEMFKLVNWFFKFSFLFSFFHCSIT